jgi:hypothetical protein
MAGGTLELANTNGYHVRLKEGAMAVNGACSTAARFSLSFGACLAFLNLNHAAEPAKQELEALLAQVENSKLGYLETYQSCWPTVFVLDAKGVIRYHHVREKELDEAVDALLAEMKAPGQRQ